MVDKRIDQVFLTSAPYSYFSPGGFYMALEKEMLIIYAKDGKMFIYPGSIYLAAIHESGHLLEKLEMLQNRKEQSPIQCPLKLKLHSNLLIKYS